MISTRPTTICLECKHHLYQINNKTILVDIYEGIVIDKDNEIVKSKDIKHVCGTNLKRYSHIDPVTGITVPSTYNLCSEINSGNCQQFERKEE